MADIGTATIKITPEFDVEDLAAQIRAAVAEALRKMADEMGTPADTREPALWGYHIGDRVRYTETGIGLATVVRVVGEVKRPDDEPYLRLDDPDGSTPGVGHAFNADQITPA